MDGEVDAETAAYVERLRAELPAAIASYRGAEIEYVGLEEHRPLPRDLDLQVDVREDGLPDLVVGFTVHTHGSRPPRLRARFRLDAEWRQIQDLEVPGGFSGYVACELVMGGAWETPDLDATPEELAAADANLPDAAELWADLARRTGGAHDEDGNLVIGGTTVVVTPEQWREHVIGWEVEAGRDRGTDAMRSGDGPAGAYGELADLLGPRFVVWWRGDLWQSRRRELPPL